MSLLKILKVPNEILTSKSTETAIDEELKTLANDLLETLNNAKPKGAGLAAPQIGILKRVCVVKRFTPDPLNQERELETSFILINPLIIDKSLSTEIDWEGCLSIPDTYGKVRRHKRVKIESLDLSGGKFVIKADGFFARVIQHEIDHLDGILFTSKTIGDLFSEKELDDMFKKQMHIMRE